MDEVPANFNIPAAIAGLLFLLLQLLLAIKPDVLKYIKVKLGRETRRQSAASQDALTNKLEALRSVERQLITSAFHDRFPDNIAGARNVTKELFYFDLTSIQTFRAVIFRLSNVKQVSDISRICHDAHCAVIAATIIDDLIPNNFIIFLMTYEGYDVVTIHPDLIIIKV